MRKRAMTSVAVFALITVIAIAGHVPKATGHLGHSITVSDVSVNEGSGLATFVLTVAPAPEAGETVSVRIRTNNGSAIGTDNCPAAPGNASHDYVALPLTTVTWNPGETTKHVGVTICQDASVEGDEIFFLNLSEAGSTCVAPCVTSGATIGRFQGVATIIDDEGAPALAVADRAFPEGLLGTTTFGFEVSLSAPTNRTVSARYTTRDGTALAGSDYQATSGTVTFPPGSVSQTVNVLVNGDGTPEADETFFLEIDEATNAQIGDPQGTGFIVNDDGPTTSANAFTIDDVARAEGNTGTSPATPFSFTVTLGQAPGAGRTAFVNYHVTEGTATVGVDYLFVSGTLVFEDLETAKVITVPVVGDTTPEGAETFTVILTGASCTTTNTPCATPFVADNQGIGTINNDDGATPSPSPGAPVAEITGRLKVGGYFQARITAEDPCQAGRLIKVKRSQKGVDKVMVTGTANADGVYKEAVRPRKSGRFYAQVYDIRRDGPSGPVLCKGGKSPIRTLPA